jgi:hypothetical protein
MDIQKEWDLFVAHLRTLGVVKISRNALGVITNLTREGNCSLGYNDIELMWETWQVRAKAVPEVKLSRSITLTCAQLREAFMFGAPDKDDQEQLETEMTITWSEDGHSGKGYYCYYSELPEEGAIFLDEVIEAQEQSHD